MKRKINKLLSLMLVLMLVAAFIPAGSIGFAADEVQPDAEPAALSEVYALAGIAGVPHKETAPDYGNWAFFDMCDPLWALYTDGTVPAEAAELEGAEAMATKTKNKILSTTAGSEDQAARLRMCVGDYGLALVKDGWFAIKVDAPAEVGAYKLDITSPADGIYGNGDVSVWMAPYVEGQDDGADYMTASNLVINKTKALKTGSGTATAEGLLLTGAEEYVIVFRLNGQGHTTNYELHLNDVTLTKTGDLPDYEAFAFTNTTGAGSSFQNYTEYGFNGAKNLMYFGHDAGWAGLHTVTATSALRVRVNDGAGAAADGKAWTSAKLRFGHDFLEAGTYKVTLQTSTIYDHGAALKSAKFYLAEADETKTSGADYITEENLLFKAPENHALVAGAAATVATHNLGEIVITDMSKELVFVAEIQGKEYHIDNITLTRVGDIPEDNEEPDAPEVVVPEFEGIDFKTTKAGSQDIKSAYGEYGINENPNWYVLDVDNSDWGSTSNSYVYGDTLRFRVDDGKGENEDGTAWVAFAFKFVDKEALEAGMFRLAAHTSQAWTHGTAKNMSDFYIAKLDAEKTSGKDYMTLENAVATGFKFSTGGDAKVQEIGDVIVDDFDSEYVLVMKANGIDPHIDRFTLERVGDIPDYEEIVFTNNTGSGSDFKNYTEYGANGAKNVMFFDRDEAYGGLHTVTSSGALRLRVDATKGAAADGKSWTAAKFKFTRDYLEAGVYKVTLDTSTIYNHGASAQNAAFYLAEYDADKTSGADYMTAENLLFKAPSTHKLITTQTASTITHELGEVLIFDTTKEYVFVMEIQGKEYHFDNIRLTRVGDIPNYEAFTFANNTGAGASFQNYTEYGTNGANNLKYFAHDASWAGLHTVTTTNALRVRVNDGVGAAADGKAWTAAKLRFTRDYLEAGTYNVTLKTSTIYNYGSTNRSVAFYLGTYDEAKTSAADYMTDANRIFAATGDAHKLTTTQAATEITHDLGNIVITDMSKELVFIAEIQGKEYYFNDITLTRVGDLPDYEAIDFKSTKGGNHSIKSAYGEYDINENPNWYVLDVDDSDWGSTSNSYVSGNTLRFRVDDGKGENADGAAWVAFAFKFANKAFLEEGIFRLAAHTSQAWSHGSAKNTSDFYVAKLDAEKTTGADYMTVADVVASGFKFSTGGDAKVQEIGDVYIDDLDAEYVLVMKANGIDPHIDKFTLTRVGDAPTKEVFSFENVTSHLHGGNWTEYGIANKNWVAFDLSDDYKNSAADKSWSGNKANTFFRFADTANVKDAWTAIKVRFTNPLKPGEYKLNYNIQTVYPGRDNWNSSQYLAFYVAPYVEGKDAESYRTLFNQVKPLNSTGYTGGNAANQLLSTGTFYITDTSDEFIIMLELEGCEIYTKGFEFERVGDLPEGGEGIASGTCGEGLTWVLDFEGTLTISGEGEMDNFTSADAPWAAYSKKIQDVVIGAGVTGLGETPFLGCQGIMTFAVEEGNTSFSVADDVLFSADGTTLVKYPAQKAGNTYKVPETVKAIADFAFADSTLTGVEFAEGLESIGKYAFDSNSRLAGVAIPASVTSIGDFAFHYCRSIATITVAEASESYMASENVLFNKAGTALIKYAPKKADTTYEVPAGVTSISGYAFNFATALTEVVIPEGVEAIGISTFAYCTGLEKVTIPESVTVIDEKAFSGCTALAEIVYGGSENAWAEVEIAEDVLAVFENATVTFGKDNEVVDPDVPVVPEEPEVLAGDADGSGKVDTRDIIMIRRHTAGGYDVTINVDAADVDDSGKVDTRDIILIRRYCAGGYDVELK